MNQNNLRIAIEKLNISQVSLANLLDVTPRAVNTWLSGSRSIPGPVIAYVNLLISLPTGMQQIEINRSKKETQTMKDGMYFIEFSGRDGIGEGCLVFDRGRIYGVDTEAVKFDGDYQFNESDGMVDVSLDISVPPNVALVQGFSSPISTSFKASTKIDPSMSGGSLEVKTDLGDVNAKFRYLRMIPEAA